jgi:hypothetical protein
MLPREAMVPEHLMTVAIAEKESTELLSLDLITIRDYPKDKRLFPDHMVEFCAQVVLNPESSEHSYSNKSKQLKKPREQQQKSNDYL